MKKRKRRIAAAIFGHGWRSVVLGVTFVVSLPAGVVLHAQLPATRRLAAAIANTALDGPFQGKIVVDDVQKLSVGTTSSVKVGRAKIIDPDGKVVIEARGVDANIDLALLLLAIANGDVPHVTIDHAHIAEAEVFVDANQAGEIGVARTFVGRPKPPSIIRPKPPSAPKPNEPAVLHIHDARIGKAKVHGNVVPPSLEGSAEDLRAKLEIDKGIFTLNVLGGQTTLEQPRIPQQKAPIRGNVTGELIVVIKEAKPHGKARLEGDVGGIPVIAVASIDAEQNIDAEVTIAKTEAAVVTKVFPDLPLAQPVEIKATAKGKLPTIVLHADATIGSGTAKIDGEIDTRTGKPFKADVDLAHIDARAFGASAETDISAKVHSDGVLAESPSGTFRVVSSEGTAAGQPVPPAVIEGSFDTKGATATFRAKEPGVDASGKVTVSAPEKKVTFDLQARSDGLRSLRRAPNIVSGTGSARAQGSIDLETKTIHAKATATGDYLEHSAVSARHATANGTITGPIDAPTLDVTVDADDLKLKAKGKEPLVYPQTKARAKVALFPTPRLIDATVNVGEAGKPGSVVAKSEAIHIANGTVEARGIKVEGLGAPLELDAKLRGADWHIRAKSTGVDLHKAAAVTGFAELKLLPEGSRAAIDVDLTSDPKQENGHADIVVTGKGFKVEAHAKRKNEKLALTSKATVEGYGELEITNAELEVPGRIDGAALTRVTGTAEFRGWIDLAQLAPFMGENVESMSGRATYEGRIVRGAPNILPDVRFTAQSHELSIVFSNEGQTGMTIAGVDAKVHAHWDGMTDDGELAFITWDAKGALATGNAKAKVPLVDWATGKQKINADVLANLDVDAVVDVPQRDASAFPKFLGLRDLTGAVAARLRTSGPLGRPSARFAATIEAMRGRPPRQARPQERFQLSYEPLDGEVKAQWDGEEIVVSIQLDERAPRRRPRPQGGGRGGGGFADFDPQEAALPVRTRKQGHVRGLVLARVRAADLIAGRIGNTLPWNASGELDVTDLEISPLPTPVRMSGAMTGRFSVRDLNGQASLQGHATIEGFGVNNAVMDKVDVTVGARHGSVFASLIAKEEKGSANITLASRSLVWKSLDLDWDPNEPTRIDYDIKNLRLAVIQPLLRTQIPELTGRLDGRGSASVDATSQVFEGGLAISKTRLYVTSIGEEMTDVKATAKFEKSGIFRIDDAYAKIGAGELRASATGRMKGLRFLGANATIIVPSKEGIPISSEGATFASATGEIRVAATLEEAKTNGTPHNILALTVDVPRANIELPDKGTAALQPLEDDPTIAIGIRRADDKLDETGFKRGQRRPRSTEQHEARPTTTRLAVTLGDDVSIEGRGLRVTLGGKTIVEVAEEVRVTGRIDLRGGTAEVHGRRFKVDRGTITFPEGGDPANPTVLAAAYWDSPDRTRVWVEFAGPLKTGKITLRSEPPYSKNEILSVLLFGRPDPNMAASGEKSSAGGGATAVGSGFVAGDINRMLAELDENLDVETDTLSGNRTRTKVGYGLFDRRLKVQLAYAPGRTYREPDTTFLLLNWQFVPKWSLVGTRGDRGTTILDVIFQHRY